MTNSDKLHDVLTSLFIEEKSWALEARLFDYEKSRYWDWEKTKVSLERLRTDLEISQNQIIWYIVNYDESIKELKAKKIYKIPPLIINKSIVGEISDLLNELKKFMIIEDIKKLERSENPNFYLIITIYRREENWPIIIKKVELIDLSQDNQDTSKKWWNIYQINIWEK